jgi:carbonic anhydrase
LFNFDSLTTPGLQGIDDNTSAIFLPWFFIATMPTLDNLSAANALQLLKDGNTRYMEDHMEHPHEGSQHRVELSIAQHPFAIILGCADSRVIPELIFDQGVGDLFVIRLAGNVADDAVIASIEYAIEHLGTRLVVVLGHENCGAVKAAVNHEMSAGKINSLLYYIEPALNSVLTSSENLLEKVIKTHARQMVDIISHAEPILSRECQMGDLSILPAYYSLSTGKVDFEDSLSAVL